MKLFNAYQWRLKRSYNTLRILKIETPNFECYANQTRSPVSREIHFHRVKIISPFFPLNRKQKGASINIPFPNPAWFVGSYAVPRCRNVEEKSRDYQGSQILLSSRRNEIRKCMAVRFSSGNSTQWATWRGRKQAATIIWHLFLAANRRKKYRGIGFTLGNAQRYEFYGQTGLMAFRIEDRGEKFASMHGGSANKSLMSNVMDCGTPRDQTSPFSPRIIRAVKNTPANVKRRYYFNYAARFRKWT